MIYTWILKNIQLQQDPMRTFPQWRGKIFRTLQSYQGKNLQLIKNRLIVQTGRASDWNKNDVDSTSIICLAQHGNNALLYALMQCTR